MSPTTLAAGFVAKALANTHPNRRGALLVELMQHAALGLAGIVGDEGASEELFRMGDMVATRNQKEAA